MNVHLETVAKLAIKGREQPGQMGVTATPRYKEGAYWTYKEKKECGSFDQNCFDHYAFYVGHIVTHVFYNATKASKGVWELAPGKFFITASLTMQENAPLQTSFH